MDHQDHIKKLMLAGIGALSAVRDESAKALDDLAKKGEQVLNHEKAVNEPLHHNTKQTEQEDPAPRAEKPADISSILSSLNNLSAKERETLLEKLNDMVKEEKDDAK